MTRQCKLLFHKIVVYGTLDAVEPKAALASEDTNVASLVASSGSASSPVTIIKPSRGWAPLNLRDLWDYRELLYFLTWRDVKIRYKQTVLGAMWAIVQPVFTMIVFTIFLGRLGGIEKKVPGNIPYAIFAYCALLPWSYFAQSLSASGESLVKNSDMITKVYFPRLVIPLSSVMAGLVDFAIAFSILIVMMLWFGIVPTFAVFALPLLLLMAIATALGVGLWLSALNVYYRDFRYTIPFIIQFWLFATPVAYPSSLVPENWRALYGLNPMAGVVEGFRWALLGEGNAPEPMMLVSAAMVLFLLISGMFYFRKVEQTFTDVV